MNEWNEEKLDRELELLVEEFPEQEEFERKIEQYIKKKIRAIVLRTLMWVACTIGILALIIHPAMSYMYMNPYKLNSEKPEESVYLKVLRDYWETVTPYVEINSVDVKRKGFARYEVSMCVNDHIGPGVIGPANVWCKVVRGKYVDIQDSDGYLRQLMGRFDNGWYEKAAYIDMFRELPASANIYLSIGAEAPKNVNTLREEEITLQWIEVYQPNVEYQGGLSMQLMSCVEKTDHRNALSEEELIGAYVENLKNLIEHHDVWKSFELSSGSKIYVGNEINILKETYEDAQEMNNLQTKNYCISGKRDEVIEYLEKTDIYSILVDEITLF